ncbi:probable GTP-binding protein OBGM, mitochondrial [Juglans microcarpa x Juglans regia]|uniref:probable GTP-binding protein OBGM, mitochondrial n=1 Tax=Juglans microcarpa x Juglans regia TaxID=2249226 RepID=UPI001B7E6CA8|nr:probable GTP-binding protein OBGM, mitochondrial [Juglans microcarpa x Juglans regia]XP_040992543.1 probable GTP-binding protein OBGM, mitochondrial [Juglans microcarpa x Juglans regia]
MWICCRKSLWHLEALRQSSKSPWLFSIFSLYSDTPHRKSKLAPLQERKMIDRFRLNAKGGDGGNGCSSFHRSRQVRRGRPDGGSGGRGGDVILESSPTVWDFSGLQHHITANRGGPGASKNMIGTRGEDKVVYVPVGTVIHLIKGEIPSTVKNHSSTDLDPWEIPGTLVDGTSEPNQASTYNDPNMAAEVESLLHTGCSSDQNGGTVEILPGIKQPTQVASTNALPQLSPHHHTSKVCKKEEMEEKEETEETEQMQYNVAELTEQGQRVIVARGGEGGSGNVCTSRVPNKLKSMKPGVDKDKTIDVEVSDNDQSTHSEGLPGSESLLELELKSIADVSFVGMPNAGKSTLLGAISRAKPSVGHYAFTTLRPNLGNLNFDDLSITVADVPGLIKGAHENRGLGHAFLRHIERTKVLAYVLDLASALDGRKGIPPWEQLKDLILELEYHQEGLSGRPSLIVANKIDEDGAEEVYRELKRRVPGVPIFPVCAVLEEGIAELKTGLKGLVNGEISCGLSLDEILLD